MEIRRLIERVVICVGAIELALSDEGPAVMLDAGGCRRMGPLRIATAIVRGSRARLMVTHVVAETR